MLLFLTFIEITSFVRGRTGIRLHSIVSDGSSAKYTCTGRLKKSIASLKILSWNFANSAFASTRTRSRWIRIFQHDDVPPLIGVCPSVLIWTKSTHNDGSASWRDRAFYRCSPRCSLRLVLYVNSTVFVRLHPRCYGEFEYRIYVAWVSHRNKTMSGTPWFITLIV